MGWNNETNNLYAYGSYGQGTGYQSNLTVDRYAGPRQSRYPTRFHVGQSIATKPKTELEKAPDLDYSTKQEVDAITQSYYTPRSGKFFTKRQITDVFNVLLKSKEKEVIAFMKGVQTVDMMEKKLGPHLTWAEEKNPNVDDEVNKKILLELQRADILNDMEEQLPPKVQSISTMLYKDSMDQASRVICKENGNAVYLGSFGEKHLDRLQKALEGVTGEYRYFAFVCLSNHWHAIFVRKGRVEFFNSFGSGPQNAIRPFLQAVMDAFDQEKFFYFEKKVQKGGTQCGMFCLVFVELRLKGWKLSTIQKSCKWTDKLLEKFRLRYFRVPEKELNIQD